MDNPHDEQIHEGTDDQRGDAVADVRGICSLPDEDVDRHAVQGVQGDQIDLPELGLRYRTAVPVSAALKSFVMIISFL